MQKSIRQYLNNIETDFLNYDKNVFSWNKDSAMFVVEASDLKIWKPATQIVIQKDGLSITFIYTHSDMDGSNEDTYGWRYKAIAGNRFDCGLLIIND